ncbi:MAG: DUF481 domain-containing protein [Planctomycetes bacterium]|nr:DUF481 domain-containing protein [Planctomycetota bacterium]
MPRFLVLILTAALFAAALCAADEMTTTDGSKLVGKFDKLEAGMVHFTDASAGALKVPLDKVATLTLEGERKVKIRRGADVQLQEDVTLFTRDGEVFVRGKDGRDEATSLKKLPGINETVPDLRPLWTAGMIGVFSWTEGNSKTYAMGFRGDVKRETSHNVQGIYAEGNYLQDRNVKEMQVRRRDYAAGYYYRYVFDFKLTIDLTEDLSWNEIAGYHWRSITGVGPGYYFIRNDHMSLHAGAAVTWTFEDQMNGGEDRYYWGARARAEFDWTNDDKTLHVNAKSEVLFDFAEFKNIVINSSLLAEAKLASWLSAGLLIRHSWDNLPTPGFFHHDFTFTFTLGVSWSGRGF